MNYGDFFNLFSWNINHIIYACFGLFIVLYILSSLAKTGEIFPNVIRGLLDSGKAYRLSHGTYSSFATIMAYIGIVLAPITAFITPLFFIYTRYL